jgi:hypothetical protein
MPIDSPLEYVLVMVRVQQQEQPQQEYRQQHGQSTQWMIVSWITAGRRSVAARAATVWR